MYDDFSRYHETLRDKLSRGAIDVTAGAEEDRGAAGNQPSPEEGDQGALIKKLVDTHSSLFNPIQDVEEGRPNLFPNVFLKKKS